MSELSAYREFLHRKAVLEAAEQSMNMPTLFDLSPEEVVSEVTA